MFLNCSGMLSGWVRLFSGSTTNLTPKGLYKYLLRQCNRIPHPELQKYYKHHIRQVKENIFEKW